MKRPFPKGLFYATFVIDANMTFATIRSVQLRCLYPLYYIDLKNEQCH